MDRDHTDQPAAKRRRLDEGTTIELHWEPNLQLSNLSYPAAPSFRPPSFSQVIPNTADLQYSTPFPDFSNATPSTYEVPDSLAGQFPCPTIPPLHGQYMNQAMDPVVMWQTTHQPYYVQSSEFGQHQSNPFQAIQQQPVLVGHALRVTHTLHPAPVVPYQAPLGHWWPPEESFEAGLAQHVDIPHGSSAEAPVGTPLPILVESTEPKAEIVCFGTIPDVSTRWIQTTSHDISSPLEVQIESSDSFSAKNYPDILGRIPANCGQMIAGLLEEETLHLHALCSFDSDAGANRPARSFAQTPCMLEITVYGPLELLDEIGPWFDQYDVFLQDPRVCYMDVKYCNPQRLSSDDLESCPRVSQVVARNLNLNQLQATAEIPDLLEILNSNIDLEEASQPAGIRTALQRHQKQALTFMRLREEERAFDSKRPNIWQEVHTDESQVYINRVSEAHQIEEPQQFYGGIIADPMGLGKTLTMIALSGTDLESNKNSRAYAESNSDDVFDVAATLIIVPPPLLGTWEEQMNEHVHPGELIFRRHHGKSRMTKREEFGECNIVFTTYHTVSAEWKGSRSSGQPPLFSVRWKRIVLDEAHFIRNPSSQITNAVCALSAISRWAVTGTPIQNHLGDLASILKFIRVYPYDDPKHFERDISRLWKSGDDEEAVKRLQRLSSCLLLRRPKGTIYLPPRQDLQCPVDFTTTEREVYDRMRNQALDKMNDDLDSNSDSTRSGIFFNALKHIESLRLFCDLGLHYHKRHCTMTAQAPLNPGDWEGNAQKAFNTMREMGSITCLHCAAVIDLTDTLLSDSAARNGLIFSSCMRLTCSECSYKLEKASRPVECGHSPPCPAAQVSLDSEALEEVSDEATLLLSAQSIGLSSKVKAFIADFKSLAPDVKCVVFSSWRLTLDMIESGLKQEGIASIRFDGKVPQKERQTVVDTFRADPDVRVMLLTLSCGAVGLTLTVASRAYLIEPHWNPSLEEQALARIHRLGQKTEVTTVRFFMRDSIEEQVLRVQESKKHLASVLLSAHDGGQMENGYGGLQMLRSLLR